MRYLIGDELFDKTFKFKAGQFILTQKWEIPMDEAGSMGNLPYHFYDDLSKGTTVSSEKKSRLETRTVFNHSAFSGKHPGRVERLENATWVDGYYIVFDPESPQNILSGAELDQKLRRAYDDPQGPADFEKLELYTRFPNTVPSFGDFPRKSAETIAEEAKPLATTTLSDVQWEVSRGVRDYLARGLRRVLNFPRLVSYLQEAEEAYLDGDTKYDVLCRTK